MRCLDDVQLDWSNAALTELTTGTKKTVLPDTGTDDRIYVKRTAPVTPGHRYTLTVLNHDDDSVGGGAYSGVDGVTLS